MVKEGISRPNRRHARRSVITLVILATCLYILIPQLDNFQDSLDALNTTSISFALLSVSILIITTVLSTFIYQLLAQKKIRFSQTFIVQLATGFTNKLLPIGAGGLTTNVSYLHKKRHTIGQASAAAGLCNSLGFVGHLILLIIITAFTSDISGFNFTNVKLERWYLALLVVLLIIGELAFEHFRQLHQISMKFFGSLAKSFEFYKGKPWRLVNVLLLSMLLTACYGAILYISAYSLGVNVGLLKTFLVFSFAILAGTFTPTPGGIGGFEAALAAGFHFVGIEDSLSLSIALLYRFITYWLPLLPGYIAFHFALKKNWL